MHAPLASRPARAAAWDTAVALGATVAAVYVPLAALPGFVDPSDALGAEWALTAVFAADALVQVRRARRAGWDGERTVAFAVDGIAAAPLFLLGVPALFLPRLAGLVRVGAAVRASTLRHVGRASWVRVASFAYGLVLTVHLVACGFVGLGGIPDGAPDVDRYLDALYWSVATLTTVGYGDVLPQTPVQKAYAIGVMLLGVGVYAALIGNIASLVSNLDPLRAAHLQQRERLDAFMRYREIPLALRDRIRSYQDHLWEQRLAVDEDAALAGLPPALRDEVALHLRRDLVEGVPLFAGASDAFLRDVALQMRSFVALPGDVVVHAGRPGREMYVIGRGTVEVQDEAGDVIRTLSDGDFFGEVALVTDRMRTATVRAATAADLYVLDRAMYERVATAYPDVAAALAEAARDRLGL